MQFKQALWLRKKSNICVALPSLGISRTAKYAAFLGICDALILNFLLCHPKIDFLRDCHHLCGECRLSFPWRRPIRAKWPTVLSDHHYWEAFNITAEASLIASSNKPLHAAELEINSWNSSQSLKPWPVSARHSVDPAACLKRSTTLRPAANGSSSVLGDRTRRFVWPLRKLFMFFQ